MKVLPESEQQIMSEQEQNVLRAQFPECFRLCQEFKAFNKLVQEDLQKKCQDLREQRKLIPTKHNPVKNYLTCQIFMIGKHKKRLQRFEREVDRQVDCLSKMLAANKSQATLPVKTPPAKKKGVETIVTIKLNDNQEKEDNLDKVSKLIEDMDKMKRRIKHILDVTDRFCVLHVEELKLKTFSNSMVNISTSSLDMRYGSNGSLDQDEVDFGSQSLTRSSSLGSSPNGKGFKDMSPIAKRSYLQPPHTPLSNRSSIQSNSSMSSIEAPTMRTKSPLPRHLTENVVRSTFESFACHLAVIAKTYTARRRSNPLY